MRFSRPSERERLRGLCDGSDWWRFRGRRESAFWIIRDLGVRDPFVVARGFWEPFRRSVFRRSAQNEFLPPGIPRPCSPNRVPYKHFATLKRIAQERIDLVARKVLK